ncbi:MAG: hypothetical protein Sapg2KO_48650 [Saprospiraceae bacterium]
MKIKCILLDLGGVVFNSTGVSNDIIDWKIISQLNSKYGHDLNVGQMTVQPFLAEYNQLTQQNLDTSTFLKNIFDSLVFNAELVNYLAEIAPIHILSDNYRENIAYIAQRYNFDQWSNQQFYSYDFELTKSESPEIFKKVLEQLKVDPAHIIFIDDSPDKIANAELCDIPSILFQNNDLLIQHLERYHEN